MKGRAALANPVENPLPVSWLGRGDAPPAPPAWATIGKLSNNQLKCLQAQLGYDFSRWNYSFIGNNNSLGRYQITPTQLETYGLLVAGSNSYYGADCVNYVKCWQPRVINNVINAYQQYYYDCTSLIDFLNNTVAQEHLAYQIISDLYRALTQNGGIVDTDSAEIIAGMIAVAWGLGAGTPGSGTTGGSGAWAWRYGGQGNGINLFNGGRYSVAVLSQ